MTDNRKEDYRTGSFSIANARPFGEGLQGSGGAWPMTLCEDFTPCLLTLPDGHQLIVCERCGAQEMAMKHTGKLGVLGGREEVDVGEWLSRRPQSPGEAK